jgi:hypothetical protein
MSRQGVTDRWRKGVGSNFMQGELCFYARGVHRNIAPRHASKSRVKF